FKAYPSIEAAFDESPDALYISIHTMNNQTKELQQQGSSAAVGMEMERLKLDCKRSMQMVRQWKN
ncbi:Protein ROOT INITIATION DEFTIVE 3, partial [Sarracenia purpurea var. burkii]